MQRLMSAGGTGSDDMRQFNYYGGGGAPNIEEFTEADIAKLEQEVEELLKNRFKGQEGGSSDPNVVNIEGADFRMAKSAHVGTR